MCFRGDRGRVLPLCVMNSVSSNRVTFHTNVFCPTIGYGIYRMTQYSKEIGDLEVKLFGLAQHLSFSNKILCFRTKPCRLAVPF